MTLTAAPAPCGSCPYRCDVPSGVWEASEYEKLTRYDGPTWGQDPAVFMCHRQDGKMCAGWLATHDPVESLALRLAVANGRVDPSIFDYTTDVPCFGSGAEAAEHGLRELEAPSIEAMRMMEKLTEQRTSR